jgi:hypothetical protein
MSRQFSVRSVVLSGILFLLALPAAAAPILNVAPSLISLSATQTVITFDVDPNGTALSAVVINLSALASGLQIVSIQSPDAEISASGPALVGSDYQAGFVGTFLFDRSSPFTVGTVTVEGFTVGTPLVVAGNFTDSAFSDIFFGPFTVATVTATPEPTSAALLSLGLLVLGARPRRRA